MRPHLGAATALLAELIDLHALPDAVAVLDSGVIDVGCLDGDDVQRWTDYCAWATAVGRTPEVKPDPERPGAWRARVTTACDGLIVIVWTLLSSQPTQEEEQDDTQEEGGGAQEEGERGADHSSSGAVPG